MRVHVLQHVPFESIGSISQWLESHRAEVTVTRFYKSESLPSDGGADLLVAMGGPMSVNGEKDFPWLKAEKQFIRDAIAKGIPVLGICLGAQLIASALGSKVYPNRVKEIGWFPIEGVSADDSTFSFPSKTTVFHWHGETFDLPQGTRRLATSAGCENQGFQLGRHVIALQFHLEVMPENTRLLIENCSVDLTPGPFVQSAETILNTPAAQYGAIHKLMTAVLSYLLD
jgi:GMP synthase-like glutamine amidotransferase